MQPSDAAWCPDGHDWTFADRDGETWGVCSKCGFGEMWAGGVLIKSDDMTESNRLDGWELSLGR